MEGFWADLHIHTVLSPCAEVEMIPPLIVRRALELGLDLIAITDHNASDNAAAVMEAAARTGLKVLPGMELQTQEEVHLLCLFDDLEKALAWQSQVWKHLPPLLNREEFFGPQFIVDSSGDWVRSESQMLAVSAGIPLEEAVEGVQALGGLAIPAHVDRPSFSLFANLGVIPERFRANALEVSRHFRPPDDSGRYPSLRDWPLLRNGDAHRLADLGRHTRFWLETRSLSELALALQSIQGRRMEVQWQV